MDSVKLLIGVLADTLGKNPSELESALMNGSEGDESLRSKSEVESYLKSQFKEKFKSVSNAKAEEIRGRAIKETYQDVESKIKEELGIDGRINDGLFSTIKEKLTKPAKANPDDIRNTDIYKQDIAEWKSKLKKLADEKVQVQREARQSRVYDHMRQQLERELKSERNKFVLPEDESTMNLRLKNLMRDLKELDIEYDLDESGHEPTIRLMKDGQPYIDDETYNEITFSNLVVNTAKSGYFQQQQNTPRTSGTKATTRATGVPASTEAAKVKVGNDEYQIPAFESYKAYADWRINEGKNVPMEVRVEASKIAPKPEEA